MDVDHQELLAKMASLYYEEGLGQAAIATRTGYSRSMVSRLLTEARSRGIVEIHVHYPLRRRTDLEHKLQELLALKVVRVAGSGTLGQAQALRRVGVMAAQLIDELAHDVTTMGVSWGMAVYETVMNLHMSPESPMNVIQMIGSLGAPNPEIDGPELAQQLARNLMGRYTTLPAPLFVDNERTRRSLLSDSRVKRVLSQFRDVELALVGVGTLEAEGSSLLRSGYLTSAQAAELKQAGAVGDVCINFFDREGQLVNTPLTRCVVGIDPDALAAIPLKIGVAGGATKKWPIIGASRGDLINVLVTDDKTAMSIVQELSGGKKAK